MSDLVRETFEQDYEELHGIAVPESSFKRDETGNYYDPDIAREWIIWSAAWRANGGEVIVFGNGDYTIEVGRYDGQHAVFIAPANPAGTAGELAPPTTGDDKHRLAPGERVMTFPTEAQAFAVAEAIAGRRINRIDGSHPAPPSVAVPEGWLVSRKGDGTFPRFYFDKGLAEDMVKEVELPPSATMSPVYTHPSPPSVAVPEGLIDEIKREIGFANAGAESHKGVAGEQLRAICIGKSQALQYVLSALTAAPSPDHSGDVNKMVDVECCCGETEDAWRLCPSHGPNHIADAREVEPVDDSDTVYRIGDLGNQIHNLGCSQQNNEELADYLAELAHQAWNLQSELVRERKSAPSDTPSVPENELKAQTLEWFADWLKRQSFAHKKRWTSAANEALRCATRLRTAGDEGEARPTHNGGESDHG